MSETKHTSGPFDLSMGAGGSGGLFVRDAKRRLIAGFHTTSLSDEMLPEEGEANAQLFIAAGDMLAALKELKCYYCGFSIMQHVLGGDPERCYGGKDTPRDVVAAIAAIAKAGTQ